MAAFTDAYWTVEPFGLRDAEPAQLMALIRGVFAERNALLAGKPVQRPMLRHRHWRQRLVPLPLM